MNTYQISVGEAAEIFKGSDLPMAVSSTETSENGEIHVRMTRVTESDAEKVISFLKQATPFLAPAAE